MKTLFKSLVLIAAAAFTFAGCAQEEMAPRNNDKMVSLRFNIQNADEEVLGRALLGTDNGKTFLDWEDGDKIGTFSVGTFNNTTESKNNAGTVEVSGSAYTLNVQTFNAGSVTNIYSYYPYSAAAGKEKTAAVMTIPETQTMAASGFDADAMPMAGAPVAVDLETAANTDTPCGTINFSNLGAIINFKVYSSTATAETITSVKYITTGNLGGAFTIDLTEVDASNESTLALSPSSAVGAITTVCSTNPSIGTGKDNAVDVYMVVAPGTFSNTQVVVTTSAHTYTLNASNAKTYERSHIKPLYVDIQLGEQGALPTPETWSKVTRAADFTPGTYYILRGDGAYYLPNAVASSGAPACVSFTGGTIGNAMRWTATQGTDGLVFESVANAGKYLWGANTNNGVRVTDSSTSTGASKEWHFTTVTVGETTYYTAYAYAIRYLTSYGTQDWRNYTSASATNIPAEFYKLDDGRVDPNISYSPSSASITIGDALTQPTLNNTNGLQVSYASGNTSVATVDSNGAISVVGVGEAVITCSWIEQTISNITYLAGSATYTLTVLAVGANDGSQAHPFTVAEVRSYMDESESNRGPVYIRGTVSSIYTPFGASNGKGSFYISDDGETTSDQFEAYAVQFLGNVAWANGNTQIAVGDEVIIYGGELTIYNSSVYETKSNSGSYLYSLNGSTATEIVPTITKTDITGVSADGVSGATTTITLSNDSDWNVAVVGDGTIVTSASISGTTITYSVAANSGSAREGSITITLSKSGRTNVTAVITVGQSANNGGGPVDVTGPWATWGSTSEFTVSSSAVRSKVSTDFCGTSATLKAYNSSDTQQTITGGSYSSFYFAYFNAGQGSYWQIDLPVTEDIPSGTEISISYYHAVNSKGVTSWTVYCNNNALGNAVTIATNGSPTQLSDMTHVEKTYTTTAIINKNSVITFKIVAGTSGQTKNNRITNIEVSAN